MTTMTSSGLVGANGDFCVPIMLSGASDWGISRTLNKATIAGAIDGCSWDVLVGDIGSITAGLIEDSTIRAGVDPSLAAHLLPDDVANYNSTPSEIGNVTVRGRRGQAKGAPTFMNSVIAAWQLGKISLGVVDADSGGLAFGLAGHTMESITGETETETLPKAPPFATTEFGDFRLVLVS